MVKRIVLWLIGLGALAGAGAWIAIYAGFYNVAATQPHTSWAYDLMHYAMQRSVKVRADDVQVPQLDLPERIARGHALYRAHCEQCHGGAGVPPQPFALGLRPLPTNLAQIGREWPPNDLYWVVKHGVRLTAMPAWAFRFQDRELWDLVAFIKHFPLMTPAEYQAPTPPAPPVTSPALVPHLPSPEFGKFLIAQYMCATCHVIPGVAGAVQTVGPPLTGLARRTFIGGTLPNTPENLVRWVMHPQQVRPRSAMPDLGVGEDEARHIAAYLGTLQDQPEQ